MSAASNKGTLSAEQNVGGADLTSVARDQFTRGKPLDVGVARQFLVAGAVSYWRAAPSGYCAIAVSNRVFRGSSNVGLPDIVGFSGSKFLNRRGRRPRFVVRSRVRPS